MPSNKGGSSNGGIIGKSNKTSFGKDKLSVLTSSSPSAVTTQPGTRFINYAVVAGGGGGGTGKASPGSNGGGGGAGGLRSFENVAVCGNTALGAVTIGAGGANSTDGNDTSFVFDGVTYTADSGGAGGDLPGVAGSDGGSGGGGAGGGSITAGGSGNTPPTDPPQGNNGAPGLNSCPYYGGGGGGSTTAGKRACVAYTRSAVRQVTNPQIMTEISKRDDKRFNYYAYSCMRTGAVRMEEKKVVQIGVNEAA